ncbi:wax ester/triacylglycerol synthase domain-containing protein [Streptomyces sp. NPDC049577]|uniref:wax ester/triacylglycerol synthase domain-containing protein n=1 Tax=Streptomyces sp. NPDC049577 TaxID=3155153 RepID=UPI00342D5BDD
MSHPMPLSNPVAPAPDSECPGGAAMPPLDAWLYRQQSSGEICMTAGVLAWFEGVPPTRRELRELARERWSPLERLRLTPWTPGSWPRWTTGPVFDPDHHIAAPAQEELPWTHGSPEPLEERVGQLIAQPLGSPRPPWQLHLLPADGGFALLLRAHHALLDGKSLTTLLCALLDGQATPSGQRPRAIAAIPAQASVVPDRSSFAHALADILPRARPLPFHGPVDPRRTVAWCRLSQDELGAARAALPSGRASTNAVFLAATAGALRAAGATGRLPSLPGVCAMVPVDVRAPGEASVLGNHYATVRVPLPGGRRPRQRLAAVDEFTRRAGMQRRARAQARRVAATPQRYGVLTHVLSRYVGSTVYSSLLCSSLATYAGPLTLGTARLTGIAGLPPLSAGRPLAVTMALHDTSAAVTVVTDQRHRELADRLPGLIRGEIHALGS